MPKRNVTATRDEQVEAVEEDVDAGRIDADRWGDSVPDGEKLRVLAEAYSGSLEIDVDGGGDSGA